MDKADMRASERIPHPGYVPAPRHKVLVLLVVVLALRLAGLTLPCHAQTLAPVSVVNVLVLYTLQARDGAGGTAAILKQIDLAMLEANTVFQNSHAATRVHLVLAARIDYRESGSVSNDLARLRNPQDPVFRQAHELRDQFAADLVCLVTETGSDWWFYGLQGPSADNAFSIIRRPFLTGAWYFPVVLSFNFGCQLERGYADSVGAFPYAYGYSFVTGDNLYSTVEAFSGQRLPFFSNPGILFQGVPAGAPAGTANSANNTLVINQTAPIVAAFRGTAPRTLPPTVKITAPADGATCRSGVNVALAASAADTDGRVSRVDYYEGTNWLSSSGTTPFKALWRQAVPGQYSIIGAATDNQGATTVSDPVQVTVRPVNDGFANRIRIIGTNATVHTSNWLATSEPGEPDHAGSPATNSLWWSYTAPAGGVVTLNASDSSFAASLSVYTGSVVTALSPIASTSGNAESAARFQVSAGKTYQIALDSPDGETGDVVLALSFAPSPANDNFAHRRVLTGTHLNLAADNRGATREAGEPDHSGTPGCASLWWSWTAPAAGELTITPTSSVGADLLLGVYTGDALTNLAPVAASFDYPASFVMPVQAAVTYDFAVDSPDDPLQPAPFVMRLDFTPEPPNDAFAHRTPIKGTWIMLTNSSALATTEPDNPAHNGGWLPTLWWSWTAPLAGYVSVGCPSGQFVDVFTGTALTNLVPVALGTPANFEATGGTTYAIAASGVPGDVVLNLAFCSVRIVSPANGACIDFGRDILVEASTTAADGPVEQIAFFVNGVSIGRASWVPYAVLWRRPPLGSYTITAVATDRSNHTRASEPSAVNVGPANDDFVGRTHIVGAQISLTNTSLFATLEPGEPGHGNSGLPSIWWSWTAPDAGDVVISSTTHQSFDVYVGASLTNLTPVASGPIATFQAVAGTTYAIAATGPPGHVAMNLILYTLRLTAPANGARFAFGRDIVIEASTFTTNSRLVRVEFFANGQALGAVTNAPYTLVWTNALPGNYSLTASAKDPMGHSLASSPCVETISVSPPNDNFENRAVIRGASVLLTNTLAGASSEPSEQGMPGTDLQNSIWWSWTAPASGLATLSFPNGQGFRVCIGNSVSNLTVVASGWGEGIFQTAEGTNYVISAVGTADDVVLRLTLSTLHITNPPDGTYLIGGRDLEIDFGTTPVDASLTQVEAFANGVSLGVATNRPFSLVWSNLPEGNFAITAAGKGPDQAAYGCNAISVSVGPTNDYFANRIILTGSNVVVGGDTMYATSEGGEPFQGFYQQSVWYSWTAPVSGDFVLDVDYLWWPPLFVTVYTGADLADLRQVINGGSGSVLRFHAAAGTNYQIAVVWAWITGWVPPWENFTLTIRPQPPNDNFDQRIAITNLLAPVLGNDLGATREPGESACPACDGQSVWWTWTPLHSGLLTINGSTTGYSPQLHLYTGSSLSNLVEVLPSLGYGYGLENLDYQVKGGCAYQIAADGNWNPDWSISFTLSFAPGPDNDDFGNPLVLTGTNATATGDTSLATSEPGEPNHAGHATGRSVWYSWTAPARGALALSSTSAGGNPVMAVYSGTVVSNLASVASTTAASLTFMVDAGATYAVAVDGGPGPFSLNLALSPAPGNDYFANRQPLHGLRVSVPGSVRYATTEEGESWGGWEVDRSVWYSWPAPADGLVRVRCPSFLIAVYTGDCVSNLLAVSAVAFDAVDFQAVAGIEYELAVGQQSWWSPDDFTLTLEMPKVQIINPTNGAAFVPPTNLDIVTRTIDLDGAVRAVALFDGTNLLAELTNAPFQMTYTNPSVGSHLLSAQATDEYGLVTTSATNEVRIKPPNDDFAQRFTIAGSSASFAAANDGATTEPGESLAGGATGRTLWWTWTAPTNGTVTITTTGFTNAVLRPAVLPGARSQSQLPAPASTKASRGDASKDVIGIITEPPGPPGPTEGPLVAVYSGSDIANLSLCASNTVAYYGGVITWPGPPYQWCVLPSFQFTVTEGQTCQLSLDGVNGSMGLATIGFSFVPTPPPPAPPSNDSFAHRLVLTGCSFDIAGTTVSATREPGEPSHGTDAAARTVWYSWTAPASGTVQLQTSDGGNPALALGIYAGSSLWSLIPVTTGFSSAVFYALAGTTYQIAVAGPSGLETNFDLTLNAPPPPPGIDPTNTVRLSNGTYRVRVTGVLGQSFIVQASSNSGDWVTIRTDTLLGPYLDFIDPAAAGYRQRFYRVLPLDAAFGQQPFRLVAPSWATYAGFSLRVGGMSGQPFRLQASTNLLDWVELTSGILANEPFAFTDGDTARFDRRFYRALKQ